MPNIPTGKILVIDLNQAFNNFPMLFKGLAYEMGRDIITHTPHQNNNNMQQLRSSTGSNRSST